MAEQKYYCKFMEKLIDPGLCYDMQMICEGFIKPAALPDVKIDIEDLLKCCNECRTAKENGK